MEDKPSRFLRTLNSKLTEDVYSFLFAAGFTPGVLYRVPKFHKVGCPVKPAVSALRTFNYNFSFFFHILTHITNIEFSVKNSTKFVDEILRTTFNDQIYIASFNVQFLLNNNLSENIEICMNLSQQNKSIPHNLSQSQFKTLLELAVKELVFIL